MESSEEKKGQNQGGRPNLADEEVRAHRLVTRMNTKDYRALSRDFEIWREGGVGRIADYLREIILNRHMPKMSVSSGADKDQIIDFTQSLYSIRQQLKHIDVNYNQVAKRINSIEHTGKLYFEVQASKTIIDKLEPIISQIDVIVKAQTEALYNKK
ncbi:hypothetical protein WBJ53_33010 (plasmid) [Spirosoma sp. SC4-14]|uniref:plasmid mobilization protein n=1 Tax=Spirosoma sp. SC4-14 TaxID=3128900 RepID=UPI0030D054D7